MNNADQFQLFLFDDLAIRGQLVHLDQTYLDCLERQNYPKKVEHMMGQFVAAITLLSSSLKFDGRLILQAQGEGQVKLMMAECKNRQTVRAICQLSEEFDRDKELFENANLALTIEPTNGQPYQSFIQLEEDDLTKGLEDYFLKSEQIKTIVHLSVADERAAGMMIQAMPQSDSIGSLQTDDESFDRIEALFRTITDDELLVLENEEILFRLFHEEKVRVFESRPLSFECGCSRDRCIGALQNLGLKEAHELIEERGSIEVDCQFCKVNYVFGEEDLLEIFPTTAIN